MVGAGELVHLIGQSVSRYRIVERLGAGGMGEVYRAVDPLLKRSIALKFPLTPKQSLHQARRFLDEARAASRLDHPNIARVFDFGDAPDGRPFIVMEYVDGDGLKDLIRNGRLSPARTLALIDQVLTALEEAHKVSLVHRDIKPGNIIVNRRGQVKVLDFGLAKQLAEVELPADGSTITIPAEQTVAGGVVGTPQYMSPEQAQARPLDGRSDLFSVGTVMYECLTGQPPFRGQSAREVMDAVIRSEPPAPSALVPNLPPEFDAIVAKGMAKNPADRYQNAEEMRRALGALSSEPATTGIRELAARALHQHFGSRHRRIAAVASLVFVAAGTVWLAGWITERVAVKPSPEANRFYQEGVAALRDGTYYRASRALERATSLDDGFRQAHARLAEAWNELDYHERAQTELLKALSSSPRSPPLTQVDTLFLEALRLTLSREFRSALGIYERIVHVLPAWDRAASLVDLGRAYERNDDTHKAQDCYLQATRIDSQYAAAFLRSAILLDRSQKQADAQAAFQRAEEIYRALSNMEGVTEVYYQRGRLSSIASRVKEADELLADALKLARVTGSLYQEINIRLQQSAVTYLKSETATAEKQAREAIDLARRAGMSDLASRGLNRLGNALFVRGDLAAAEAVFRESLDYARSQGSRRPEAVAQFSLASLHLQRGDWSTALGELDAAQAFFDAGGYKRELGQTLVLRSRAYRHQGNYEGALQIARTQLDLAEKSGDRAHAALVQETVASSLLVLERFPEALDAYRRVTELGRPLGDKVFLGYALMNSAKVCARLGLYAEAERAIAEAEKLAGESGGLEALRMSLALARAEIAFSLGHISEGRGIAKQVEQGSRQQRGTFLEARMLEALALARSGNRGPALQTANEVLEAAKSVDDPYQFSRFRLAWSEIRLAAGRTADARQAAADELPKFEKAGQLDSAWHCAVVVTLAEGRSSEADSARNHARQILDQMRERWPPNYWQTYSDRPDQRRYRRLLGFS